ncbi:VOC family protein [Nocardia sp. NPDC005978]|uniref:VOC family protein n=1 Tax=unclassified Nocardia TaxID=2637762 RepID=UPI0033A2DBFC
MATLTTYVWFDNDVEYAAKFYAAVIPNSQVREYVRAADGHVLTATLNLAGQTVTLTNSGPGHPVTDTVSFRIAVDTQEEIDRLWDALTEGGRGRPCGWLTDRFGLSWQVVPSILSSLTASEDAVKSLAADLVMRTMTKIDIKVLRDAYDRG